MGQYDERFYANIRDGIKSSAEVVVPMVKTLLEPDCVIDVGGGEGWWAREFFQLGSMVTLIDGDYVEPCDFGGRFIPHDIGGTPLPADLGQYDLAVCLEVAEHLPPSRGASFITELCGLAPAILFSAAIPGQGGTGHVNEQWPDYWAALFDDSGYAVTGALRFMIWGDGRVENWYRQNLLLAMRADTPLEGTLVGDLFTGLAAPPHRLVHPVLYDARRR